MSFRSDGWCGDVWCGDGLLNYNYINGNYFGLSVFKWSDGNLATIRFRLNDYWFGWNEDYYSDGTINRDLTGFYLNNIKIW